MRTERVALGRVLVAARRLGTQTCDLDETVAHITAAAVEVLPKVKYASIAVKHADGRLETSAPTTT